MLGLIKKTIALALALNAFAASAAMVMPDFGDVPTDWTTDRYEPNSFSNVGTYQGRSDVLGIGISDAQGAANRPGGQQGTFYNTQGRKSLISGGAGSVLAADVFIPEAWGDESKGSVRTDMWGTMQNGTGGVSSYPIFGFANTGATPRLQVYDGDGTGWITIGTSIAYDAWTSLSLEFTGSSFVYRVNGVVVHTDNTVNGTTGFKEVIMQAYNFNDASLTGVTPSNYTAYWANTAVVPEPSTIVAGALAGIPLLLAGFRSWRSRRTASKA